MVLHPLISGFKTYLQLERNLSMNTVEAYLHDVDLFYRFLLKNFPKKNIQTVLLSDLQAFIAEIGDWGLGAYSQSRVVSGLKAFFNFLMLEKVLTNNPASLLESPKLGQKLPVVLTEDEVIAIIDSVDLSQPEGERNKAILEVLYGCGLRVSELINLQLSHLHFKEEVIVVTGKGNKQRLVPIGAAARKQLEIYIRKVRINGKIDASAYDTVFLNRNGKALSRQMIFLMIKKQATVAGITKTVSPHTFRHSFATHLVQHGADLRAVQQLLGHVSITTTEIYTHLNTNDLRITIEKFHPQSHFIDKM